MVKFFIWISKEVEYMISVCVPAHICSPTSSWASCPLLATFARGVMGSEKLSSYERHEKKQLHSGKRPFLYSSEAKAAIWTTVNTHGQIHERGTRSRYLMDVPAVRKASARTLLNIRRPKFERLIHRKLISMQSCVISALRGMTSLNTEVLSSGPATSSLFTNCWLCHFRDF